MFYLFKRTLIIFIIISFGIILSIFIFFPSKPFYHYLIIPLVLLNYFVVNKIASKFYEKIFKDFAFSCDSVNLLNSICDILINKRLKGSLGAKINYDKCLALLLNGYFDRAIELHKQTTENYQYYVENNKYTRYICYFSASFHALLMNKIDEFIINYKKTKEAYLKLPITHKVLLQNDQSLYRRLGLFYQIYENIDLEQLKKAESLVDASPIPFDRSIILLLLKNYYQLLDKEKEQSFKTELNKIDGNCFYMKNGSESIRFEKLIYIDEYELGNNIYFYKEKEKQNLKFKSLSLWLAILIVIIWTIPNSFVLKEINELNIIISMAIILISVILSIVGLRKGSKGAFLVFFFIGILHFFLLLSMLIYILTN